MLSHQIITTKDGSTTIQIPEWNEQYHSKHGAIQEAKHVFLKTGLSSLDLDYFRENDQEITVLEAGFGTGLNAFLSYFWAKENKVKVNYISLEAFPVAEKEVLKLNYPQQIEDEQADAIFKKLHSAIWDEKKEISSNFKLHKIHQKFDQLSLIDTANIVFYDAFGPRVQPDLWDIKTLELFKNALKNKGVFVTYCAKGSVRRNLESLGFQMNRMPGPPGKREMLRGELI
ncbi:MAG: tRNA (5-methylaminomethyl-2-thiouridine)(34)-methyltransferase MnmD [Psychroflexus halocasei]